MRILGIDPGLATTGWAVVDIEEEIVIEDFGVVSTEKGNNNEVRLSEIFDDVSEIIKRYKPDTAAIETLLFNSNVKTAMSVGEARGVILLAFQKSFLSVHQYTPLQVKNSITGNGRADKKQVQENVMRICNLKKLPKPDDAADAVAVAICCYDSLKIEKMTNSK